MRRDLKITMTRRMEDKIPDTDKQCGPWNTVTYMIGIELAQFFRFIVGSCFLISARFGLKEV